MPGPSGDCVQINKQIRVDTKLLWQRSCIFIPLALPIGSSFGVNAVESVGKEAKDLVSGPKCLIVTDAGIAKAGFIGRIQFKDET